MPPCGRRIVWIHFGHETCCGLPAQAARGPGFCRRCGRSVLEQRGRSCRPRQKLPFGRKVFCKLCHVPVHQRSEEHTSELQSLTNLVCRLLLEKKKKSPQTP